MREGGREGGEGGISTRTHSHYTTLSQTTAAHKNGKFDLCSSSSSPFPSSFASRSTIPLFLGSAVLGLGAGLRKGARVRVWNIHPICLGGQVEVWREVWREGGMEGGREGSGKAITGGLKPCVYVPQRSE